VNGIRLEDSVFGREAGSGALADRFAGLPARGLGLEDLRRGVYWLAEALAGPGVWLADAETDQDLRLLAAAALASKIRLLCGSAGLARAAVGQEEDAERGGTVTTRERRYQEREGGAAVLVVAGSRHPATEGQVLAAERAGLVVVRPTWEDLRITSRIRVCAGAAARALAEGRGLVISAGGLTYAPGEEARAAGGLARLARATLREALSPGGLVLTGGDVAAAVCRATGCRAIEMGGEVLPGLGWGRLVDGEQPGLPAATKAGGFGDEDALVRAAAFVGAVRQTSRQADAR
jgi:uncharacterized protein YgbK (DUF1537 family)